MKAFVITPGKKDSGKLIDLPEPPRRPDQALVEVLELGVCATDLELIEGVYGEAPPGEPHLIIGHESLGRVVESPNDLLQLGDLVVAMVRRPDPEPCLTCAVGEADMCLNDRYTERGIKSAHGFLTECYVEEPRYLIALPESLGPVAVLLEPLSIVEKALDHITRIQARLTWEPHRAMVIGAGTIGTIAALLLRFEGMEVYVYSRGDGKQGRRISEAAGATFISSDNHPLDHALAKELGPIDIVIEATGHSPLAFDAIEVAAPNGVICLTGVTSGSRTLKLDADHLNLEMVLGNKVLFGTVSANGRHFEAGVAHLHTLTHRWPGLLEQMITSRVPLADFTPEALSHPSDLKVVVDVQKRP